MTRRTERLSRLLRLWLTTMPSDFTTMPSDFTTFPRLCDFRPNDFATFRRESATLTELPISPRGRRLFFSPADRRRVLPGRRGRCRGSGLIVAAFLPFIMYSRLFTKNLDFLLRLHLTSKRKYAILQLPKRSKCKSSQRQATGRKGNEHGKHYISDQ